MSIEKERIARCVGWLEGFAPAVWAMISTPTGEKLFDASVGDEYEATVRMLREALYAPKCGIVDPMQDSPRPKVTYESVGEWHLPTEEEAETFDDMPHACERFDHDEEQATIDKAIAAWNRRTDHD